MARPIKPGKIYRHSRTPSGYLYVTEVDPEARTATGWGDQHGYTMSARFVVSWSDLRNTKRKGPFVPL